MAKYVIAVSGGRDSVALLHMAVTKSVLSDSDELIVAHFDHGIRSDSSDDAAFVAQLAQRYGLPFHTRREELGPNASEETARRHRYAFLRSVADNYGAVIVTAHHADDVVETIAINLVRGTGWRGLAVLNSPDIVRPLLDMTKAQLTDYAVQCDLEWREDATNSDTMYLRNALRQKLDALNDEDRQILRMYRKRQVIIREKVDNEAIGLVGASPYSRHLFINVPDAEGAELLRAVFRREKAVVPTRPQLARTLHAIKVLRAGKQHEVAAGLKLQFTKTHFVVHSQL